MRHQPEVPMLKNKTIISGLILICVSGLTLSACSTTSMKVSTKTKPGFSNITDIPLPESAKMDLNKSLVMGGGESWTGHLVYETNKPQAEVIDFMNTKMQDADWTKISELRGKETVITFMKEKRVATIRIINADGYLSKKTIVSIDKTYSKLRAIKSALIKKDDIERDLDSEIDQA